MRTDLDQVRASWEQRAAESGTSPSGVLFRNLSAAANQVLSDWHATIVRDVFLPELGRDTGVLDLGCGYGRLSSVVAQHRPDIQLVGQDLSLGYCRQYGQAVGPCAVADVAHTPFAEACFDGVLCVTCLMYVPRESAPDTLRGLRALLRPGGVALLLDPALELQEWIARVLPRRSASPTGGAGFRREEYRRLVEDAGLHVLDQGGNPALSLGLLVPGVAKARGRVAASALTSLGRSDRRGGYSRFALHRWLLARRVDSAAT